MFSRPRCGSRRAWDRQSTVLGRNFCFVWGAEAAERGARQLRGTSPRPARSALRLRPASAH